MNPMKAANVFLCALMLCSLGVGWIAAGSSKGASIPPRQRLSRTLTPEQIASFFTNAPPEAKVSVPLATMQPWTNGVAYAVADPVTHQGAIYLCIQAHTAQSGWTPSAVPALWRQIRAAGETLDDIPAWVQPLSAEDAYELGAKVQYNNKTWENTTPGNVWAPGNYGWKEITP